MKDTEPNCSKITETIAAWRVSGPQAANTAMQQLAETYLEDDRFPQGPNEEISLLSTGKNITLNVTRTYGPGELNKISS
jgi:hypothetical protein